MAKLVDFHEVTFTEVKNLKGYDEEDFLSEYIGKSGLLCIYVSENHAKGKKFVYFYPCELNNDRQEYFYTSLGEITIVGKEIKFKSHHNYTFEVSSKLDKRDWELLLLNAYPENQMSLSRGA